MKLNISILLTSLFVLMGCGSSSSDNTSKNTLLEEKEQLAIFIPNEKVKRKESFSQIKEIRVENINKLSKDIKEDAERAAIGTKWIVYDGSVDEGSLSIVYDDKRNSRVIEFNGDGLHSGYVLGYSYGRGSQWNDKKNKIIQWSASFFEEYYFYVRISTVKGYRYLYYTPRDHNYGVIKTYDAPHYIHHGLGTDSTDGKWRTFTRDLDADLKEFEPDNKMISIDGFFVRGSGLLDNIVLLKKDDSEETIPSTDDTISEIIEEIVPSTDDSVSISIEDAVKAWLLERDLDEMWDGMVLSSDKSRAMVRGHKKRSRAATLFMLDISDLYNIKELNSYIFSHKTAPSKMIIKDNDYLFVAAAGGIFLYDYNSGKEIFRLNTGSPYSNNRANYLLFEDNRVIYSNYRTGNLQQAEFTNRNNPQVTTLYDGEKGTHYRISSDNSTVIVEEAETNKFITEIDIRQN